MPSNLERAKKEYQKSREEIAKAIATRFYDAYIANHIPEASLACLEMADSILSILASHGFGIRGEKLTDEDVMAIRRETQNRISALCNDTEGNFKQADIDAMYDAGERTLIDAQYDQFWGIEELRK